MGNTEEKTPKNESLEAKQFEGSQQKSSSRPKLERTPFFEIQDILNGDQAKL